MLTHDPLQALYVCALWRTELPLLCEVYEVGNHIYTVAPLYYAHPFSHQLGYAFIELWSWSKRFMNNGQESHVLAEKLLFTVLYACILHVQCPDTSKNLVRAQMTLHSSYLALTPSPSPFSLLMNALSFGPTFLSPSPTPSTISGSKRRWHSTSVCGYSATPNPNRGLVSYI